MISNVSVVRLLSMDQEGPESDAHLVRRSWVTLNQPLEFNLPHRVLLMTEVEGKIVYAGGKSAWVSARWWEEGQTQHLRDAVTMQMLPLTHMCQIRCDYIIILRTTIWGSVSMLQKALKRWTLNIINKH